MDKTYSLAVIGSPSTVLLYRAVGAVPFAVSTVAEAEETLHHMMRTAQEGDTEYYAVCFVEEQLFQKLSDQIRDKMAKRSLPAVIPVPTGEQKGKTPYGVQRINEIVERAIGTNIFQD
ncbi:hypothetical protein H6771_02215 [Candidatus Peribacteria bacterium]|nr:hypothetical protein [Candidatus Peribacteria bacterium]